MNEKLRPATPFAMGDRRELYVCYGFDVSNGDKRHVVAAQPIIDNTQIVHHVLLFQAPAAVPAVPAACSPSPNPSWRLVTGWAPGGTNFELPAEAGFPEDKGITHWVLQIHYNNALGTPNPVDRSGYDLCTTGRLRPNDADVLATGFEGFVVQPGRYARSCTWRVGDSVGKIRVLGAWAHMHLLGTAQFVRRLRGNEVTTVLDASSFSFSTGAGTNEVAVDVEPGDQLRTTCQWNNNLGVPVPWGEGTNQEMCYAFLTYYPRVTSMNWRRPSQEVVDCQDR